MKEKKIVYHTLEPFYDAFSKVLILGSMPSIKSRENGFYYAHPQNRFWSTLAKVYEEEIGMEIEDRKAFLRKHHIALYDVIKCCEIESSSDSSIKNVVPNDLSEILQKAPIVSIYTTGQKAYALYKKYCYSVTHKEAILLPSTSPANCPKGILEKLEKAYGQIRKVTG